MDQASRTQALQLRAKLALHGLKIRQFARQRGFSAATVHAAISGVRHGEKSKRIIREIESL